MREKSLNDNRMHDIPGFAISPLVHRNVRMNRAEIVYFLSVMAIEQQR